MFGFAIAVAVLGPILHTLPFLRFQSRVYHERRLFRIFGASVHNRRSLDLREVGEISKHTIDLAFFIRKIFETTASSALDGLDLS